MNKTYLFKALAMFAVFALLTGGCHKGNDNSQPLTPLLLVTPDSAISTVIAGDATGIQIKYTPDRPIDWILGLYDVDTLVDSVNYMPAYHDTLFSQSLYSQNPR